MKISIVTFDECGASDRFILEESLYQRAKPLVTAGGLIGVVAQFKEESTGGTFTAAEKSY